MALETMADVFGSGKTIKAEDLNGEEHDVVIIGVKIQEFDDKDRDGNAIKKAKPILTLGGWEKSFVCNVTNARKIAHAYGDRFAGWVGKPICLYPDTTDFGGRTVDCIRVRIPKPKAKGERLSEINPPPFDDEIPF